MGALIDTLEAWRGKYPGQYNSCVQTVFQILVNHPAAWDRGVGHGVWQATGKRMLAKLVEEGALPLIAE